MPADVCGPFTLEQLNAFGTLDSLAFSLDSSVWTDPNVCLLYADGVINATAQVTAIPTRTLLLNVTINAQGQVTALGGFQYESSADISAYADVQALGGVEYSSEAYINGYAELVASPYMVWGGYADINCTANVVADGTNLGHNWTPVPVDTNIWSDVIVTANTWNDVPVTINKWESYKKRYYVKDGYWDYEYTIEYIDTVQSVWTDKTVSNDKWLRVG